MPDLLFMDISEPRIASIIAIHGLYELTKADGLKRGILVTREMFWNTPGHVLFGPAGVLQLFRVGVTDLFFIQQFGAVNQTPKQLRFSRN